jgi:hypothetical protein
MLWANATEHDALIQFLLGNASSQDMRIVALEAAGNPAADNNVTLLWVNASAQEGRISALEIAGYISSTASQDGNISMLWLNASGQDARIAVIEAAGYVASTAAQDGNITMLWANASGLDIRILATEGGVSSLWVNASNQEGRISALEGEGFLSSTAPQDGNITGLWTNASDQQVRITTLEGRPIPPEQPNINGANITSGNIPLAVMPPGWLNKTFGDTLYQTAGTYITGTVPQDQNITSLWNNATDQEYRIIALEGWDIKQNQTYINATVYQNEGYLNMTIDNRAGALVSPYWTSVNGNITANSSINNGKVQADIIHLGGGYGIWTNGTDSYYGYIGDL